VRVAFFAFWSPIHAPRPGHRRRTQPRDSMTLQHTPLNAIHRSLGARMVDFGGWDMPVNYGSQIEEHHAVRQDAGIFDVSHMCVVDLTGARVRDFLRGLLANNVDKLQTPGKALYSCMLNPKGGVIDDLIVYFFREDWFRLVVNAGTAPTDLEWIVAQNEAAGTNVTITPRRSDNNAGTEPLGILAVQGPNARAKTYAALPGAQAVGEALKPFNAGFVTVDGVGEIMVARTGYTGEDGLRTGGARLASRRCVGAPAASRRPPGRSGCARHAAPGSRHEPLRPGHGRARLAARRGPGLDGRPAKRT